MKKFARRAAAVILTGALLLSGTGCASTTWIAKSGGVTYPAGLYLMQLMTETGNAQQMVADPSKNMYAQTIDGIPTADWIDQQCQKSLKKQIAIAQKFDEMGLSFTEEEQTALNDMIEMYWGFYAASYESSGVAKTSYAMAMELSEKSNKVFEAIYGEGGEQEVADEALRAVFEENFMGFTAFEMKLQKTVDMKRVDDPEAKERAEQAYERAMNGEDMYVIIADVLKAQEEAKAAQKAAEAEATGETEEAAVEEETAAEVAEEAAVEEPENSHDILVDKRIAVANGMSEELLAQLEQAAPGDVIKDENEKEITLYKKLDNAGRDAMYDQIKSSLLTEMKGEEYDALLNEWAEAVEVEFNQKSLKRYSANELYESQIKAAENEEAVSEENISFEMGGEDAAEEIPAETTEAAEETSAQPAEEATAEAEQAETAEAEEAPAEETVQEAAAQVQE